MVTHSAPQLAASFIAAPDRLIIVGKGLAADHVESEGDPFCWLVHNLYKPNCGIINIAVLA